MKKLAFLLALVMVFAVVFTACNNNEDETSAATTEQKTEATSEENTSKEETSESKSDETSSKEEDSSTTNNGGENTTNNGGENTTNNGGENTTNNGGENTSTQLTETVEWEAETFVTSPKQDFDDGDASGIGETYLAGYYFQNKWAIPQNSTFKQNNDGTYSYNWEGIGVLQQNATGKYAYTVKFHASNNGSGRAGAFVRAADTFTWDASLYGHCGDESITNAYGDAGIYYNVAGGVLTLYIKTIDPDDLEALPTINEIKVNGVTNEITVVDLENVIYFLSGTQTVAKVVLEGTKNYDGFIMDQVEKATVSVWGVEEATELTNVLISNDLRGSYFGIGARAAGLIISEVAVASAKDVKVNENLDAVNYIILGSTSITSSEDITVKAVGTGNVALYLGETRIMYYPVTSEAEFKLSSRQEGITVEDQTLQILKPGIYTVKFLVNDEAVVSIDVIVTESGKAVALFTPEKLAEYSAILNSGQANVIPYEVKDGYITFTNDGSISSMDYCTYLSMGAPDFYAADFFAIKYRTTAANQKHELFIGTETHGFPTNLQIGDKFVADGDWHTAIIDLSAYGMDKMTHFRFDLLNAGANVTMDVMWMGFFKTSDDVANMEKIEMINASDMPGEVSSDTYIENGVILNDGQSQQWLASNRADGISGVDNIGLRGWASLGASVKIAKIGYSVDGFEPVYSDDFVENRADLVAAGKVNASGYAVTVDLTTLKEGEHTIYVVLLGDDGKVYNLDKWGTIKVIVGQSTDAGETDPEPEPTTPTITNIEDGGRMSCDTYWEESEQLVNGKAQEWLAANRADGIIAKNATFRGWASIGASVTIEKIGYIIDDGEAVYDANNTHNRDDLANAGVKNGIGYQVKVDFTALEAGNHTVTLVALGSDGNLYSLNRWGEVKVVVAAAEA